MKKGLTFDDVCLAPKYNNIESRAEPCVKTVLTTNTKLDIPIVASNMGSVIGSELAKVLDNVGSIPIFHRFTSFDQKRDWITEYPNSFMSCGVKPNDLVEIEKLIEEVGLKGICFDIAHGHDARLLNAISNLKNKYQRMEIIAGNVCTADGYRDLVNSGATAVKVGVGPGCFAAGTRVLTANASYKNIEDIKPGDRIITGEGIAATVKRAFRSGYKQVSQLRVGTYHKPLVVTADHRFLVGDLSSSNQNTVKSRGYAKLLNKQSKTVPKQSKIKWMPVEKLDAGCLLLPRFIQWELPKDFEVRLMKRSGGNWRSGHKFSVDATLTPSYDVGYLFGTFLGDGTSNLHVNKGSHSGMVSWSFGRQEQGIVDKLQACIMNIFCKKATVTIPEDRNIIRVDFHNKPLADFLSTFGKRSNKHLPSTLFVDCTEYITGLREGLLDSDGCISKEGRESFSNTSESLIELFNVCTKMVIGHFPNNQYREPSIGGLKNCDLANCSPSYISRPLLSPTYRLTNKYQVVKLLEYKDLGIYVDVYDLEIDDESHSFIAGNVIVHNSACTTRVVTGFGVPQFTAIQDIAEVKKKLLIPIISDGGIKGSADVVKALAAGADSVMIGKLFALTSESAALKREVKAKVEAKYRGQASADFQEDYFGATKKGTVPEGVAFWSPVSGSAYSLIQTLLAGLRSGMTYGGARSIGELQRKAEFLQVTDTYNAESNPRP